MATATQPALTTEMRGPLALWHLLSLDAPTVAALWVWFIAHTNRVHLPPGSAVAMALAVWILYAADRLLDTRLLDSRLLPGTLRAGILTAQNSCVSGQTHDQLEARHLFHHRHRAKFLVGIALAAVVLAALLPNLDPAAIHLYLMEGLLLVAWFLILHATRSAHRLPKEIAVGLFFAAATFIPTIARQPGLRLILLSTAILLAALCSLNCLYIYAWEHEQGETRLTHLSTRLALAHLHALTVAVALAAVALALLGPTSARPIAAACALSTLALLALDSNRYSLSPVTLRASADLALLTPLVLLTFIR